MDVSYQIEPGGLSIKEGSRRRTIPWRALSALHLSVTSGVGTSGFPVYSGRIRTRFTTREIVSASRRGEAWIDHAPDYVRFVERLIATAASSNPSLRLRRGGDPLMESLIPFLIAFLAMPFVFLLLLTVKLPAALAVLLKGKGVGALIFALLTGVSGTLMSLIPWSSGVAFDATELPVEELPRKYRRGGSQEQR